MATMKKRTEMKDTSFPCRCGRWMKVYKNDKRARGWLRAECKCGKFADVLLDSVMLTKRSNIRKFGFKKNAFGWDNAVAYITWDNECACTDCKYNDRTIYDPRCPHRDKESTFRIVIDKGHLYVLCTKKKYKTKKAVRKNK